MCQYHLRHRKMLFLICFVSPGHLGTIQNLIPGCMTIVKLIKRVKNWQSPSRDPWSNCLINSRETTKGQSYYYSGRQKDNSKTICRRAGYSLLLSLTLSLSVSLSLSLTLSLPLLLSLTLSYSLLLSYSLTLLLCCSVALLLSDSLTL